MNFVRRRQHCKRFRWNCSIHVCIVAEQEILTKTNENMAFFSLLSRLKPFECDVQLFISMTLVLCGGWNSWNANTKAFVTQSNSVWFFGFDTLSVCITGKCWCYQAKHSMLNLMQKYHWVQPVNSLISTYKNRKNVCVFRFSMLRWMYLVIKLNATANLFALYHSKLMRTFTAMPSKAKHHNVDWSVPKIRLKCII